MYKIMVVDDEPHIVKLLSFGVTRFGYECLSAHSGKEAFELLRDEGADLVLTDVRMPGGSGIELLERIRKELGEKPHVIFISGFADISDEEAKKRGAVAIFEKPFNTKEILSAVEKILKEDQ